MAIKSSFLSSPKYGYDFVVATTQKSINAGLKKYLKEINQPTMYLCFLVDKNGNPTEHINLTDLLKRTGGINPFEIPNNTDCSDERIKKLTSLRFSVGIQAKIGLPTDDLPQIVSLGSSANTVKFNLYLSDFKIIQNNPPSGWGNDSSWTVTEQPKDKPWYISTLVDLVYADLDARLNTNYFNNHPAERDLLKAQLKNLGSEAFSLQQLLFDLDNAALQDVCKIEGVPNGSNADIVLRKYFTSYYFNQVKEHGQPIISVRAVVNTRDYSTLKLTDMERSVSKYIEGNGVPAKFPTPLQADATTLNYLCAVNGNKLPGVSDFGWNWVETDELDSESGVIAINRNTLAAYYRDILTKSCRKSCIAVTTETTAHAMGRLDLKWSLAPGQSPTSATINPTGPLVMEIKYTSTADSHDKSGLTYGEFDLHSDYSCQLYFKGSNTIEVVQNLIIWLKVQWDYTSESGNIVNKTITDTYTISVDNQHDGGIQLSQVSNTVDNSQEVKLDDFSNFFVNLNDLISKVKGSADSVVKSSFESFNLNVLRNFVFPGARVFKYKDVQFSNNQDLVSRITYKDLNG